MIKDVRYIVIHCSATKLSQSYGVDACRNDHVNNRNFSDIGYHFYIEQSGELKYGRPPYMTGAHCLGYNNCSIGVCYEGGLNESGNPADTRTEQQRQTMQLLIKILRHIYPDAKVVGHRDLNPNKACPCFDVATEM